MQTAKYDADFGRKGAQIGLPKLVFDGYKVCDI